MLLADRCSREFTRTIKSRGARLYREGRVTLATPSGPKLRATVVGSPSNFAVVLDWNEIQDGFLNASCTCPSFDEDSLCEHVWATVLAADSQGLSRRVPGSGPIVILGDDPEYFDDSECFRHPEYFDDDEYDDRAGGSPGDLWPPFSEPRQLPRSRSARDRRQKKPERGVSKWRRQLQPSAKEFPLTKSRRQVLPLLEKTREVWYVLDVASSVEENALVVDLFQRETKLNGQFGRLKPLSVNQHDLDRFTHAIDREALAMLLAGDAGADSRKDSYRYRYSYYGYEPKTSRVALAPASYHYVLPRLCETKRFVWILDGLQQDVQEDGRPIGWDDGPPWRFLLHVDGDDTKKQWVLTGKLIREGAGDPVSLDQPVLVTGHGLVLMEDRLARLDPSGHYHWIAGLRQSGALNVPYDDGQELLEFLWGLPEVPEMILPEGLQWEQVHVSPRGRLQVQSPDRYRTKRLSAKVAFDYDGWEASPHVASSGLVDGSERRILVRDREKERELLLALGGFGVRPVEDYGSGDADVWFPRKRLDGLVTELVVRGWIVEAEGRRIRQPGKIQLSVTTGIDWFELDGQCDFDGVSVRLPALLSALRHGQKYVRLDDGSQGLIPQEWLAQFAAMAGLGELEDGAVRFRPSQALVLDALLAAQEKVSVDKKFAAIRRRLSSFAGISPRKEPRGFHGELRNYQREGLGWIHFLREFRFGGCLADDMGLGKTVQVLALLQARRARPKNDDRRRAPSLVVAPRSLVFNWIDEAARFAPRLRVLNYTGPERDGALELLDCYDLVITTYGTLRRDIAKIKDHRFDYAILDEAQAIKNSLSQNAKACRLIVAENRLALTGTPVENHLGELWSLFEFLNPGLLGSSKAFQRLTKQASASEESLTQVAKALAPFILRRTKKQVLKELPEKTEQTLYCDLEGKQRKQYAELRQYYRVSLSKKIKERGLAQAKIQVLEALLRLRQVACHPGLLDKDKVDQPGVKVEVLLEQLAEVIDEGHKALVFSQFTSLLAIVRRRLDRDKIAYEYLDGRTRKRKDKVNRFQADPDCPVFLISLKAGGHGLNLTAADYVFILDPWWNPAAEAQAVDRAHRIGQTRHVFAYRLIARDTVEEKIVELQKSKRKLADAIVSADSSVLRSLTAEDLQLLLS